MLKQVHHKELLDHLLPGYTPRKDELQQVTPCIFMATSVSTNETSDKFVLDDPSYSPNQSCIDDRAKKIKVLDRKKETILK